MDQSQTDRTTGITTVQARAQTLISHLNIMHYYTNFQFEFVHLILCYQLDVIQCPALELIIILSGYFYDSLLSRFRCGSKIIFTL